MKIAFSNRVENLFDSLKNDLFLPGQSLFSKRLIIVPSPAVKNWLTQQLANHFDVAFGIEISYLEHTLSLFKEGRVEFPTASTLSFAIEETIMEQYQEQKDPETWQPLWDYLDFKNSKKAERRLIALSDTLASLFQQYGVYGKNLVQEWEAGKLGGWQGALWRLIYSEFSYPAKEFQKSPKVPEGETALYLFSMSYLAPIHHRFLVELSAALPIHYYLLSPCQEFWSDILSSKESGRLQAYWKKRGVSEAQQSALEEYLSDCNPLLANYGKVGREMAKTLEESEVFSDGDYFLKEEGATLLETVQTDLCLMRRGEAFALDDSIQIHRVTSPLREVEVVKDIILDLIDKKGFSPADIIVAAPHIGGYAPYIRSVFEESAIDYQIMDLSTPLHHAAAQGFLKLLAIPFGRWEVTAILQLLENKPFREKARLSLEDLTQITEWLTLTGVKWGENAGHREQVLKSDHSQVISVTSSKGTWDEGIGKLLMGLVSDEGLIESSQAELLGKLIDLLQGLKKDLSPIHAKRRMTVGHWCLYLKELAEKYFVLDDQSDNVLFGLLKKLGKTASATLFGFSSVHKRLQKAFEKESGTFRESHLSAVRFCSMLPMRAIPAPVILLMGMQEGVFPKRERNHSLNQCLAHPEKVDFSPTIADYDRFLFLEAILSARDTLVFTYQGLSAEDGKELFPGPLVKELMQYIGPLPIRSHPRFGFAEKELFDERTYEEAIAYFQLEKVKSYRFLQGGEGLEESDKQIDVSDLSSFAKNPLKLYMNQALNLYLKREQERLTDAEKFELSHLERYVLKKQALSHSLEAFKEVADNYLPEGVFKKVEWEKVEEDLQHLPPPEEIFSITLSEDCTEKTLEGAHWIVPPLQAGEFFIVGTLSQVTENGLFVFQKDSSEEMIKAWPSYLVFHEVVKQFQLPIKTDLLFTKNGKTRGSFFENGSEMLEHYCAYFDMSKRKASLLIPQWVESLLQEDDKKLSEKMEETLPNYDIYLNWLFRGGRLPECALVKQQADRASLLYQPLFTHWCSDEIV